MFGAAPIYNGSAIVAQSVARVSAALSRDGVADIFRVHLSSL